MYNLGVTRYIDGRSRRVSYTAPARMLHLSPARLSAAAPRRADVPAPERRQDKLPRPIDPGRIRGAQELILPAFGPMVYLMAILGHHPAVSPPCLSVCRGPAWIGSSHDQFASSQGPRGGPGELLRSVCCQSVSAPAFSGGSGVDSGGGHVAAGPSCAGDGGSGLLWIGQSLPIKVSPATGESGGGM
jgi:hypothetical protein